MFIEPLGVMKVVLCGILFNWSFFACRSRITQCEAPLSNSTLNMCVALFLLGAYSCMYTTGLAWLDALRLVRKACSSGITFHCWVNKFSGLILVCGLEHWPLVTLETQPSSCGCLQGGFSCSSNSFTYLSLSSDCSLLELASPWPDLQTEISSILRSSSMEESSLDFLSSIQSLSISS